MSLGVVFKGPEGLVLAADSRVTLTFQHTGPAPGAKTTTMNAFYDNATKLLRCQGQDYVAAITYGLGALGSTEPRTAHSFLPEFETTLGDKRLSVVEFATKLGQFYGDQYQKLMPNAPAGLDMYFLIAGYNDGEVYGKVYEVIVPRRLQPIEQSQNSFGVSWGGQQAIVSRILNSYDQLFMNEIKKKFTISDADMSQAVLEASALHSLKIPYQFLPLQDCVDLSILLVKTTSQLMQYTTDVRGVGGAVDVVTITRMEGCKNVQSKQIRGERSAN
jgi:hypothetical protein